jgi:hypothetical protein
MAASLLHQAQHAPAGQCALSQLIQAQLLGCMLAGVWIGSMRPRFEIVGYVEMQATRIPSLVKAHSPLQLSSRLEAAASVLSDPQNEPV